MLRVWLPPGYDDPVNAQRHYPVFYLNDGQNLFDEATSFAGEWHADEAADRLIRESAIPPIILVGIDNATRERMREYVPYRSLHPHMMRVRGRYYPDFLAKEVMPFISRQYRVANGPENTGLGGSSLGGLIALYTAIARPGLIGRLLVESPSLWVAGRKVIADAWRTSNWPQRVYVGAGTRELGREDRSERLVHDVRDLERALRCTLGDDRLKVVIDEGAQHSESAWARRFPDALRFLFGG
jgi:predicted alpha/beta superfamily hydrolase